MSDDGQCVASEHRVDELNAAVDEAAFVHDRNVNAVRQAVYRIADELRQRECSVEQTIAVVIGLIKVRPASRRYPLVFASVPKWCLERYYSGPSAF